MEKPTNAEERVAMVSRCVELIDRTNDALAFHSQFDEPDVLAISQYTELRDRYITELAELLQEVGVTVQLPTTGSRQAA